MIRGLARFGVRNPVVANLVMFALIGAGVIFGSGLRREFFPEIDPTLVRVSAPYPGASPDEVEDALAIKIEDRIEDYVDDVKEINTTVGEGSASIMIEFEEGVNIDRSVFDVKREMDALQDLPDEVEEIVVSVFEPNFPVINVTLYGGADERTMKDAIRAMRDDLRSLRGMGDVVLSGVRADEITVEVDPAKLIEHDLSLTEVEQLVASAMIELPGGAVTSATGDVAVRTLGVEERSELIRDIVVRAGSGGGLVTLGDIARVTEGFADVDLMSRLNGEPAVSLTVYKVGEEDAVAMAALIKAYAAGLNREPFESGLADQFFLSMRDQRAARARSSAEREAQRVIDEANAAGLPVDDLPSPEAAGQAAESAVLANPINERERAWQLGWSRPPPPGAVATTTDLARFITGRLNLLSRNAAMGLVLVLGTLMLLLNFRVAFWVAAGLVVSILGTLAAMRFVGITLNLLTMFGLIIVLGLLVDDAIVVAENITRRHEEGEDSFEAAERGTAEVGWPVVSTVLTTICAFLPLALIAGTFGDLMRALPFVVAVSLGVSLIECLFILPSHMGHSLSAADRSRARGRGVGIAGRVGAALERIRESLLRKRLVPAYAKVLEWCLGHRYVALAGAIAAVMISVGMVAGNRVPFVFFPSADAETMSVDLRMPVGTAIAQTDAAIQIIERAIVDPAQFPEISAAFASVGSSGTLDGTSGTNEPHVAQMILELEPVENRQDTGGRPSGEIKNEIQRIAGTIPGVESVSVTEISGGPEGADITLAVVGDDQESLEAGARRITEELARFDGVLTISDDNEAGRRELRFELRDDARELGLTTADVARQVRGWVFGLEAHTFAGDREDVDVRVILHEPARRSLAAIERQRVFTPAGDAVPLAEVARITEGEGYATLRRLDGDRIITITADIDEQVTSSVNIVNDLRPALRHLERELPGVRVLERGEQQEMAESFATLPLGLAAAVGLIYVTLAWLFGSFLQPVVVMTAIPFATVGAIWGHAIMGFELTFLSVIGFVALTGVVVNDSLIFMEFYNARRAAGSSVLDAALETGRARLRAILLTTVTTVLGLLPLMLERSFQARFLIPMAITISFGLLSATVIILIVLPCLLVIGRDLRAVAVLLWTGQWPAEEGRPAGTIEPPSQYEPGAAGATA
ncbi:MAG: efflux RND transporter permease subunit [Planctomycetota bacterium]